MQSLNLQLSKRSQPTDKHRVNVCALDKECEDAIGRSFERRSRVGAGLEQGSSTGSRVPLSEPQHVAATSAGIRGSFPGQLQARSKHRVACRPIVEMQKVIATVGRSRRVLWMLREAERTSVSEEVDGACWGGGVGRPMEPIGKLCFSGKQALTEPGAHLSRRDQHCQSVT